MLRGVLLIWLQGVPSPPGGEVLFVLEIIWGVLYARAKGVPLRVSLVGVQQSTVGIHHLKFYSFFIKRWRPVSRFINIHVTFSSLYSTPIVSALYNAQFCSDCVMYYADCLISGFQIPDTSSEHILIEDELWVTYCRFYNLRAEQVEVAMDKSYQYHADLLAATLNALEAQWLCGGAGDVADNLEIDAVIQQPENNNRNDRAILYIPCSSQNSSSSHQWPYQSIYPKYRKTEHHQHKPEPRDPTSLTNIHCCHLTWTQGHVGSSLAS